MFHFNFNMILILMPFILIYRHPKIQLPPSPTPDHPSRTVSPKKNVSLVPATQSHTLLAQAWLPSANIFQVPSCCDTENPPKYEPVTKQEFSLLRAGMWYRIRPRMKRIRRIILSHRCLLLRRLLLRKLKSGAHDQYR